MSVTVLHKSEKDCEFCNQNKLKISSNLRQTMIFDNPPIIVGKMSIVGQKEGKGPMGEYFDQVLDDDKLGEKCFEAAELRMLNDAIKGAITDAKLKVSDIDLLISGDLLNQITSSSYVARDLQIPYVGVYSACSTMTASLAIGSALISSGFCKKIACSTSSHFATAERQFRYPLEYGCQRPPYAQWTVTGAGCAILSNEGVGNKITMATLGKVIDFGTNDLNNMGAAMAPAAMDTMLTLFNENNLCPDDFDLIITGDLGKLGSDIFRDLMYEKGYKLGKKYIDCGNTMYFNEQNCYQGGSGAACSATVFNSYVLDKMTSGIYNKVLYLATGALMSSQSCYQGETIPCISHAVVIER